MYSFVSDNIDFILNETLVDLVFKHIDRQVILDDALNSNLVMLKNELNQYFKIDLDIKLSQTVDNIISGVFIKPNIIQIVIPKNYEMLDSNNFKNQFIRTLLHELSHYLTQDKIPDYIYIKRRVSKSNNIKDRIKNKLKYPPDSNINWIADHNQVIKFLEYIFQVKELANFALTFSLSFHDNKYSLSDLNNFLLDNKYIISRNNLPEITKYYNTIFDVDLQLLFQIQYFVKYLSKSKYQQQLIKLQKLIKKYYKRLVIYYKD